MLLLIKSFLLQHKRLILLTFEIFWIAVFLLNQAANVSTVQIPQFIYVNF